jgi:Zn-dependent oligopeptidase
MKKLTRFYAEDLRDMVMEKYDLRPEQVSTVFTEEVVGYGMNEHTEPVFYIEVEENGSR